MQGDLGQRAALSVDICRKAGADDVWATATQRHDVEFNYRDGILEKVKDTTSRNLAVQIYVDGRYSRHSTTDLRPEQLAEFLADAVSQTRAVEKDPYRHITSAALFDDLPIVDLDLVDPAVDRLEREQRLAWCVELDDVARSHERLISATAGVYDGNVVSASVSSNGFSASEAATYCWLGSGITLRDRNDRRAEDSYYVGGTHIDLLPKPAVIAGTALQRTLARLDAEKGPSRKASMVVDASAAASLIARLLLPATAASTQQGRSFWAALIGKRAFNTVLSIVDDPLIPRGLASRTFDDEGIAARALPLVEEGVVRNLYVDTYYGAKGGMTPTTGTPSNRRIEPGTQSLADLLQAADGGVYVTSWLGGNADGTSGEFSLGLRGHLIEKGIVGRPVGEMNVTGNLTDLFSRLVAIGNDPYPYSTTLSPSLLFESVDFAGA